MMHLSVFLSAGHYRDTLQYKNKACRSEQGQRRS
jgi:hypothetical protein